MGQELRADWSMKVARASSTMNFVRLHVQLITIKTSLIKKGFIFDAVILAISSYQLKFSVH